MEDNTVLGRFRDDVSSLIGRNLVEQSSDFDCLVKSAAAKLSDPRTVVSLTNSEWNFNNFGKPIFLGNKTACAVIPLIPPTRMNETGERGEDTLYAIIHWEEQTRTKRRRTIPHLHGY